MGDIYTCHACIYDECICGVKLDRCTYVSRVYVYVYTSVYMYVCVYTSVCMYVLVRGVRVVCGL